LEVKAEIEGITIIDDFAHHPTAIRETLQALRGRYPGRKLWAVFEPRSNALRRKVFQNELVESLRNADEVVMASVFKAEGVPADERLESVAIIDGLKAARLPARELADADAIVAAITPELQRGDVVAILSNGGFGGIYEKLPQQLRKRLGEISIQKSEVVAKS
jgi:UDP-N-acetylmuramate: L-alanyl-gamma-D-glutamyl-meso-diaminopimelate ligase